MKPAIAALIAMSGTVALIYLMFLLIVRPLNRLEEGMRRMEEKTGKIHFNLYFRNTREFGESERLMLESLGQHLGVVIENQRLVAREKEMAVSEERNLLAQKLHDSIAQSLAFLNLQAQIVETALRALLGRFEADTGIATELKQSGTRVPLSPETQIQALHIIQECLSNVRRNSSPTWCCSTCTCPVFPARI